MVISTDKPCIREANGQCSFPAANESYVNHGSSLGDPAASFLSPPTAPFGWGHRIHQEKSAQPKPTSPTELIKAAKSPNIHNEDTDTHTYFAHKKQAVWIQPSCTSFLKAETSALWLFWNGNAEDSISHVKISSSVWTQNGAVLPLNCIGDCGSNCIRGIWKLRD